MHPSVRNTLALGLSAYGTLVQASPVSIPDMQSANPANVAILSLLERRGVTNVSCGGFSSASTSDVGQNAGNLAAKGGNAQVAAKSCNRVGCYNTSGAYVCNDQDSDISVPLSEVSATLSFIDSTCPKTGYNTNKGISGQAFLDTYGGYNVIVAYCNGNDSPSVPPSSYTAPGPNGASGRQCGGNSGVTCPSSASCDAGSIVMTSQSTVTCNEYMAALYVGAGAIYSYSTTKTVTKGWTVGGFLGIDTSDLKTASANAGFSFSYTDLTSVGNTVGSSETCGLANTNGVKGGWTCGMEVQPGCYQMSGTCTSGTLGTVPWTVIMPQSSAQDGIGVYSQNLCVCKDCPGWADNGAPQLACDLPCAKCDTSSQPTVAKQVVNNGTEKAVVDPAVSGTASISTSPSGSATLSGVAANPSASLAVNNEEVANASVTPSIPAAASSDAVVNPSGAVAVKELSTPVTPSITPSVTPSAPAAISNAPAAVSNAPAAISNAPVASASVAVENKEIVNPVASSPPVVTPSAAAPTPSAAAAVESEVVPPSPSSTTTTTSSTIAPLASASAAPAAYK